MCAPETLSKCKQCVLLKLYQNDLFNMLPYLYEFVNLAHYY